MAKKFGASIVRTSRSEKDELSVITEIKNNITVLEELKELIPPLRSDELEQLKLNIEKEGVREPLLLWERDAEYVLIDGHNRFKCINEIGLDKVKWSVKLLDFGSLESVREWMINNQLGRRNLTDLQRALLIEEKYNLIKTGKGGDRKSKDFKGQNLPSENESDIKGQNFPSEKKESPFHKLSKETGRSERTIKNDIAVAKGIKKLPKEKKEKVLTGKEKIKKGDLAELGRSESKTLDEFEKNKQSNVSTTDGGKIKDRKNKSKVLKTLKSKINRLTINPSESEIDKLIDLLKEYKKDVLGN